MLLWALLFLHPASPMSSLRTRGIVAAFVTLWHLLNVYVWFVPDWRRPVIERRGPLLGVGFAFGAAFVGAIADGFWIGVGTAIGWAAVRFVIYAIPFILPLALRLPFRPHPIDLGVIVLVAALPVLPGFDFPWISLSLEPVAGGLLSSGLGAGSLVSAALLFTYFHGARYWTLAPCDLKPRKGDVKSLLSAWSLGTVVALIAGVIFRGIPVLAPDGLPVGVWGWLEWSLAGLGLAVLVEVLLFRSLLQSWIAKTLSTRLGWVSQYSGLVAALFTAALHAGYGPFGLSREVGFLVSLAQGLVYVKSNRYFPSVVAHALTLLTLAVIASGRT